MAGFSPWSASGLLGGTGPRLAVAGGASAALWLAVLWASLDVAPPPRPSAGASAGVERAPPPPAPAPTAPPPRAVAVTGAAAPGGGLYDRFGLEMKPIAAPINEAGDVAFFARLMRGPAEEALYLLRDGRAVLIATAGGPAPGGGTITSFTGNPTPALNRSGIVAFTATIEGGRGGEAVLTWSGGRLASVAQGGGRVPGVPGGAFLDFGPPAIDNAGDVAFLATVRRGRETLDGIFLTSKGQLAKIVAAGDPAPGGGSFSALGPPALNGRGTTAFAAVVEGGTVPGGLFTASADGVRRVVAAGDPSPAGGTFARLSEHVGIADDGRLAFASFLGQGAPRAGLFVGREGALAAVATIGAPAPGGGAFGAFGDVLPMAADGRVAFIASVEGGSGQTGVYAWGPEGLSRVAGAGDALADGRRIAGFPLNPSIAAGPNGRVTFQAVLGDGAEPTDAIVALGPASR